MSEQATLDKISNSDKFNDDTPTTTENREEIRIGPYPYELPDGWSLEKLGENIETDKPICYGVLKPGDFYKDGVPMVKIEDLKGNKLKEDGIHKISEELDEEFSRSRVNGGEVLISIQGTIGRMAVVPEEFEGNISRTIARIVPNDINSYWLKSYMLSPPARKLMDALTVGTTRASLNIGELRDFEILTPPKPEQRKIATILYNVDQAIQKTEEIIEQTQRVKKGVMQDLFTKGYYDHEEYQKTRLGPRKIEIPNKWKITRFDDFSEVQQGLQIAKSKRYKENGENRYRYITVQHLKDPSDKKQRWFIEKPREKVICTKDDVLMTRTGNTGEVVTNVKGVFHNNFFKVDFDRDILKKKYLVSYLRSEMVQNLLISYAGITTIPDLNHADFGRIPLLIPPKEEQKKIAETLGSVDEKIDQEKNKREQLKRLKKGLMQNLLTGKVRTHDKNIEILDEVMEVENSGS